MSVSPPAFCGKNCLPGEIIGKLTNGDEATYEHILAELAKPEREAKIELAHAVEQWQCTIYATGFANGVTLGDFIVIGWTKPRLKGEKVAVRYWENQIISVFSR